MTGVLQLDDIRTDSISASYVRVQGDLDVRDLLTFDTLQTDSLRVLAGALIDGGLDVGGDLSVTGDLQFEYGSCESRLENYVDALVDLDVRDLVSTDTFKTDNSRVLARAFVDGLLVAWRALLVSDEL